MSAGCFRSSVPSEWTLVTLRKGRKGAVSRVSRVEMSAHTSPDCNLLPSDLGSDREHRCCRWPPVGVLSFTAGGENRAYFEATFCILNIV